MRNLLLITILFFTLSSAAQDEVPLITAIDTDENTISIDANLTPAAKAEMLLVTVDELIIELNGNWVMWMYNDATFHIIVEDGFYNLEVYYPNDDGNTTFQCRQLSTARLIMKEVIYGYYIKQSIDKQTKY